MPEAVSIIIHFENNEHRCLGVSYFLNFSLLIPEVSSFLFHHDVISSSPECTSSLSSSPTLTGHVSWLVMRVQKHFCSFCNMTINPKQQQSSFCVTTYYVMRELQLWTGRCRLCFTDRMFWGQCHDIFGLHVLFLYLGRL